MEYSTKTTEAIVSAAIKGDYAVPELQRGFVWSPRQVLDLADSLSQNFPVGSILTWKSETVQHGDSKNELQMKSWLIDGQQRTTALCTLFGKRPSWWGDGWDEHMAKFDVRLDIQAEDVSFVIRKSANSKRYIPLRTILNTEGFNALAKPFVEGGSAFSPDIDKVVARLQKVATNVRRSQLPLVEMDDSIGLEEVAEVFKRLNSMGTPARQSDIYLAVVASKTSGWVNQHFLKFMSHLEDTGFEMEPAFLFRAFTAIGVGKSRFKEIPSAFWDDINQNKWNETQKALGSVCEGLRQYGIFNSNLALSLNAVVAAAIYRAQFTKEPFGPFLAWMLCAIKEGFFGGPTETQLDRVIGAIQSSSASTEAISGLYQSLDISPNGNDYFQPEDFRDTSSRRNSLERLMIYLIAFRNDAHDWDTPGYRIRAEAKDQYRPEWHHIWPRKWLAKNVPSREAGEIDKVANMAVISSQANKKIAASEPKKYIAELKLDSRGLLDQQAVPIPQYGTPQNYLEDYLSWLDKRAERLAKESNEFLASLRTEK